MRMPLAVLSLLLSAVPAAARPQFAMCADPQTTPFVTAERLDQTLEQVANSASVITRSEIELRQAPFVADLLRSVPGLDVVQTGARGGTTSVFIRGAGSGQTLVLLDGQPLNDPSDPGRSYDLASLSTDNVERIEVLRGPQSVLYGSDAMGGVIAIISRQGEGPLRASLYGEGGSYGTSLGRAQASGSARSLDYSASASRYQTAGIPSAGSDYGNRIDDGFLNGTLSGRLGFKPAESLRLDLSGRNSYSKFDLDQRGGAGADDPSYTGTSNETGLAARANLSLLGGRLVQKAGLALTAQDRRFVQDATPADPASTSRSSSCGRTVRFEYQAVARLHPANTLTAGVDQQEEEARSTYSSQSLFGPYESVLDVKKAATTGVYMEDLMKLAGRLFISAGARRDQNSRFGSADTYRIAPSLLLARSLTKLKASLATGFKAPTLYQTYSQYGSLSLSPERSLAWDAGFEQELFDQRVLLAGSYFRNDFRDLIDFNNATQVYYNVGRARTEGYEAALELKPSAEWALKANFTYTSAKDLAQGTALLRRPRLKFGGDLEVHPTGTLALDIGAAYTGPRRDLDFSVYPAAPVVLGGYGLWHISGSYEASRGLRLTGRIENMFNKRYEEVAGYGSLGIGGYAGAELLF